MEKNLGIDKFRGETIYGDIYVQTCIRQGYMRQIEIFYLNAGTEYVLVLSNKIVVEKMILELQRIIKNWK